MGSERKRTVKERYRDPTDKSPILPNAAIIDLDGVTPMDIIRVWSNLYESGAKRVRGRLSSSGEGAHIQAIVPWDEWPFYRTREVIGDDPMRIEKDREKPWRPKNVAFESPYPWVDCPFNLIDQLQTEVTL